MKRILHILPYILLLLCAGSSFAQLNVWRWQNPLPVGNYLRAVQMISHTSIYICGDNGCFLRSTDGGGAWDVQTKVQGFTGSFGSLSFIDSNYGMCCGDSGRIVKTTDGGTTWQVLATGTKTKLNGIVVLDKNIAVTVTYSGAILRTGDGGSTWVTIPYENSFELYNIRMLRPDFLTITGDDGILLESVDEGLTWVPVPTHKGNIFYSSEFTDPNNGTLIGDHGLIYQTSDGGNSWQTLLLADSIIVTATLNVIGGIDPNTLVIVGDYGTILYTADGGVTWKQSFIGTADPVKGLSFIDKMTAIGVGRDGLIIETTDGGVTWSYLPHKAYTDILLSVAFPKGDTLHGIAVGDNGSILRTDNGGKLWTSVSSGLNRILYSVTFLDTSNVIAVGEYGTIIKSTDAGLTWNPLASETNHHLYSVSFATKNIGVIVGDSGTILRTYSAGSSWGKFATTPATFTEFFTGVSFPDSMHAFICGENSVYKSTDGGFTWLYAPGAAASRGQTISFGDSLHGGFVYTDKYGQGYIQKTSNGGIKFDSIYPPFSTKGTHSLNGICFSDRQHATVVGFAGYIAHSTDGGSSWTEQQSNTVNSLNAVSFGTIKAGTAVGYRGNIIRITSNDILAVPQVSASGSPKPILDPCYPNPAATSVNISYYIPSGGAVSIKIYTIDGKEIATLVNGYTQAGDQKTYCDVSHLASGSYFIRLDFGGVSASQRLTVMR